MLNNPLGEEIPSDNQPQPLLAQFKAISSCPVATCLGEEATPTWLQHLFRQL